MTRDKTLERSVESFLADEVQRRGGFTLKLDPTGNVGVPDRLVVLPDRILFVELKRPRGGVVARLQEWWRRRTQKLGHEHHYARNRAEVLEVLDRGPPGA